MDSQESRILLVNEVHNNIQYVKGYWYNSYVDNVDSDESDNVRVDKCDEFATESLSEAANKISVRYLKPSIMWFCNQ